MAEKSYIQRQREQSEGAKRRRERSGDSRSNLEVRQDSEQQRKFDKAVAAGVDPATAARAFGVTREGTTDIVTIQSTQGVGVTARTREGGRTTQAQEFFSRQEGSGSLGAQYAIPTDAAGRTPTDQLMSARREVIPSSQLFGGPLRYAGPDTSQFIRPRTIPTQISLPAIPSPTRQDMATNPFATPASQQVSFATADPTYLPRGQSQVSLPRQSGGIVDFFRRRGKIERTRLLSLFNPEDPRVQPADRGAAENQLALTIGAFATGGGLGAGSRLVSASGSQLQNVLLAGGLIGADVAFNRRPQYLAAIQSGQTPGTAFGDVGLEAGRDLALFGIGAGYARSQIASPTSLLASTAPVGSPGRTMGSIRVNAQRFVRDDPLLVDPATGRPLQIRTDVTATRATPIERDFLGNVRARPFEAISVRDVDTGFTRTMTFEPGRGVRTTESMIPSAVFDQPRSFGFRPIRAGSIEQGIFTDRVSVLTGTARSRGSSIFIRNVRLGETQRTRTPELIDRAIIGTFDRRVSATAFVQPRASLAAPSRLSTIVDTSVYGVPGGRGTPLTVTPTARSSLPPPTLITGVIRAQPQLAVQNVISGDIRRSTLEVFEPFDNREYLVPTIRPTSEIDFSLFTGSLSRPSSRTRRSSRPVQFQVPEQIRIPVQRQPPVTVTTPTLRTPTRDFFAPPATPRFPRGPRTPPPAFPLFNFDFEIPRFKQGKASNFDRFIGYDRAPRNLPSLTAAFQSGFNPTKAEKSLRGRSFTGIEIRGFL